MLQSLDHDDRLRLMRFVCSFAWADLEIQPEERAFVARMVTELGLEDDREQINHWLKHPPRPEEVDPTRVPRQHRELFLEAMEIWVEELPDIFLAQLIIRYPLNTSRWTGWPTKDDPYGFPHSWQWELLKTGC